MSRARKNPVAEALREVRVPNEGQAEEQGWEVVRAAFAEREAAPRPARVWPRLGLAAAGIAAAAALALTPAGASVREWLADAIGGEENARPALGALPAPGSILAETRDGAWVLRDDGSRRRLGDYEHVTWSANAAYVGAAKGRELLALEPTGEVRWALTAPQEIHALDWSRDEGFRIAYVAGDELRVVAGDGTGDAELVPRIGSPVVAWQPESLPDAAVHRLAYVDERNRVTLRDSDSREVIWRTAPLAAPVEKLQWSADGEGLLVATAEFALALGAGGDPLLKGPVTTTAGEVTLSPDGRTLAAVRRTRGGGAELALIPLTPNASAGRVLYRSTTRTAGVRFGPPAFSPDGTWILLPWPQAGQWLFVPVEQGRVFAVADVAHQLDADRRGAASFPDVAGWCC